MFLQRRISVHHSEPQCTGFILPFLVSGQDCSKSLCNVAFFISVCCHVAHIYFYPSVCLSVSVCVCVRVHLPLSCVSTHQCDFHLRGVSQVYYSNILNVQTGLYLQYECITETTHTRTFGWAHVRGYEMWMSVSFLCAHLAPEWSEAVCGAKRLSCLHGRAQYNAHPSIHPHTYMYCTYTNSHVLLDALTSTSNKSLRIKPQEYFFYLKWEGLSRFRLSRLDQLTPFLLFKPLWTPKTSIQFNSANVIGGNIMHQSKRLTVFH